MTGIPSFPSFSCCFLGVSLTPSINQATNGKRTSMVWSVGIVCVFNGKKIPWNMGMNGNIGMNGRVLKSFWMENSMINLGWMEFTMKFQWQNFPEDWWDSPRNQWRSSSLVFLIELFLGDCQQTMSDFWRPVVAWLVEKQPSWLTNWAK